MAGKGSAPSAIRAACRARFVEALPELSAVIHDPMARDSDRIKAIELLGKFGLGAADQAAVHIHSESAVMLGVVQLPALAEARPEEAEIVVPLQLESGE